MFWKKEKREVVINHSIDGYTLSDTGCVRDHNEDAVQYKVLNKNQKVISILADGMGGHNGGEIASNMFVKVAGDILRENPPQKEKDISNAITRGNAEVYKQSLLHPEWKGMGTTCVILSIIDNQVLWGHVGDSRLYLYHNGTLSQKTTDHTVVEEMKSQGLLPPANQGHVLTQAIGTKQEVDPATDTMKLEEGESYRFLLCSDGLYDMLSEYEIKSLLDIRDGYITAPALIALAKEKGGVDNVSVSIIDVTPLSPDSPELTTKEMKLPE